MTTVYQAEFQQSSLTRTMPDGTQDTSPIDLKEIQRLEKMCRDYSWNESPDLPFEIGKRLLRKDTLPAFFLFSFLQCKSVLFSPGQ